MNQEAKVRVRIDTGEAKSELRGLVQAAGGVAKRIGGGISSAIGAGVRAVGLGGGIGYAVSALQGPTQGAFGSAIGEALGPLGKQLETFFLGDLGVQAKAASRAREDTIAAFGIQAGSQGGIPAGAKVFFDTMRGIYGQTEAGRHMIESDEQFYGVKGSDVIDRILAGLKNLLDMAVDRLVASIGFGGDAPAR